MIPLKDDVPTVRTPVVTYAIIAINVIVFVAQWSMGQGPSDYTVRSGGHLVSLSQFDVTVWRWGLRPVEILHHGLSLPPHTPAPEWTTIFSSMFMHGGWLHLGGNMLYMWIFADNVEDSMGRVRFVVFYLLVGLAGAATQVAVESTSALPMVGASGAIAGIMGAYLLLHPRAKVRTIIPIFYLIRIADVPAVLFLGFWILMQLLSAPAGGGTAWFAHLGGFAAGLLFIKLFARRDRPRWRLPPGAATPR